MIRVGARGITTRRLRTVLTALAIVLGVAMVSGAYTLTDTMKGAADSLSSSAYDGTAAVVSAKTVVKVDSRLPGPPRHSTATRSTRFARYPEWRRRWAASRTRRGIVGKDGDVVGTRPVLRSRGSTAHAGELSPFRLKEGRFATGPGQVVIDAGTADREGYSLGDTIAVQARGPEQKMRVTGIGTFGDVDSIGTATFALFDLHAGAAAVPQERQLHRDPRGRAGLGPQAALGVAAATRFRSRPRRRTTASRSTA